jgi:hypothetical protein
MSGISRDPKTEIHDLEKKIAFFIGFLMISESEKTNFLLILPVIQEHKDTRDSEKNA